MIQAKSGNVSSNNHLYNQQDLENQNQDFNKNQNESNVLIAYNSELDRFEINYFLRNGNNEILRDKQSQREKNLDLEARADYKKHKLLEKEKNPKKKIRTELQSKNLKKEFIIAFGDTSREELMKISKEDLSRKCFKGALAVLKEKKLSSKNLIGIVLHYDEKGQPHAHVQYNSYSFSHKTTDTQLEKCLNKNDKKQQTKDRLQKFSDYQTTLAEAMGLERGLKGSKRQNLTINEIRAKKAQEEAANALKTANELKEKVRLTQEWILSKEEKIAKLESLIAEKQKDYEDINDKLNNLSETYQDKVFINDNNKVRVDLGYFGLNRALTETAKYFEIDYQQFLRVFDDKYSKSTKFSELLQKAKELSDKQPKNPQIKSKDFNFDF